MIKRRNILRSWWNRRSTGEKGIIILIVGFLILECLTVSFCGHEKTDPNTLLNNTPESPVPEITPIENEAMNHYERNGISFDYPSNWKNITPASELIDVQLFGVVKVPEYDCNVYLEKPRARTHQHIESEMDYTKNTFTKLWEGIEVSSEIIMEEDMEGFKSEYLCQKSANGVIKSPLYVCKKWLKKGPHTLTLKIFVTEDYYNTHYKAIHQLIDSFKWNTH